MIHNDGIKSGVSDGLKANAIARKIYLSYPTYIFIDFYDLEFEIIDSICEQFKLPLKSVQVAGSAKTGHSYHQNKDLK